MDTVKSFKGYGKVDAVEQQEFQKKTRRRIIFIAVSAVVLVAIIVGVIIGAVVSRLDNSSTPNTPASPAQSLKLVCSVTQYPDSCISSISTLHNASSNSISSVTDPAKIFSLSLQVALNELNRLSFPPSSFISSKVKNSTVNTALEDCAMLIDDAIDRLNDSIAAASGDRLLSTDKIDDMKTWLSAALTDHETCLDGLSEINGTEEVVKELRGLMKNSWEFVSNSLAIVSKFFKIMSSFKIPVGRRLLAARNGGGEFPEWLGAGERKLLQESNPTPNVVVAGDGSGDVKTITEAIELAPKKNASRFVIYVKAGKYVENVVVVKNVWNVMIYGDGMTKTVVSGSTNFIDGTPTFHTATFVAVGKGFIAKNIGFENTAGASKHQAVALRSGSDLSVFHRCSFDGYQDTLYAHSNRQFYSECMITGTIDFIFGNAAVVIQNCNIQPRQPLPNQFNTITAQGKKDKNQNTGISIHKCTFSPLDKLTAPTYLGRPWKEFSTTIIMQSAIGSFLHPLGWKEWVSGVEPSPSIFYAEYQNTGPGADVSGRVKWAGYKSSVTSDEASKYTVDNFIDGKTWLSDASVPYDSTL